MKDLRVVKDAEFPTYPQYFVMDGDAYVAGPFTTRQDALSWIRQETGR